MGVFDTYGDIQLKAGEPWCRQYKIGDDVLIPDGVYVDFEELNEKAVIVKDGKFIALLDVFDYWGEKASELNK